jgi:Ti-type conjugative transfer relaxase TraA
MAIYHFSAKVISRASGSSAVASAAYRSASRLHDGRLDRHHDFSNKAGVVHSEVMLPEGASAHLSDRERLWNEVEAAELRKDAQLAREIEFAIPREMGQAQGIVLARDFVQREFVDRGMIADLNVHWDISADGEPKPHAHVMLTMREVGDEGFGAKVRDWNSTALLRQWREAWAAHANERMADLGIEARIDHRSYEAQGIDLEPQHKIGAAGARRLERGEDAERAADHDAIARRNGAAIIARPELGIDAITHQQSTFTVRDLAKFAHRHSDSKEQFDRIMSAMRASDQIVALGRDGRGEERFTSRNMLEAELRMARSADALDRAGHGVREHQIERAVANAKADGLVLSGEQRDALRHAVGAKDFALVVGYAGSGKSAMLGVAREAWEAEGYTVRGAALAGIAAENLHHGSGIPSRTIASLQHQWARDREKLTRNDVLVVDEAGMIGTRQMERVLTAARDAGAKVVLVGDAQQLQAIEAGAAFRALTERHGAAEITEVRRQIEDWQRAATRQLATGRTAEALRAYDEAGMIRASDTRADARQALIEGWKAERAAYPARSQVILSHTRDEVRELNDLARDALKHDGILTEETPMKTTRGERLFSQNDRIIFLRNERDLGVKNGTLGTVERASRAAMSVRLDDGRAVSFDLRHYADIDHGYAATIHKAQGVTVDRVHVLATPGFDNHAAYVALSRHRRAIHLHYGRDDFETHERLVRTLGRERPKDMALDYDAVRERFAADRGYERSAILDALARDRLVDPLRVSHEPGAVRRDPFVGLRLGTDRAHIEPAPAPGRGMFDGLKLRSPAPEPAQLAGSAQQRGIAAAVERFARAIVDADRMTAQGLAPLDCQKAELARASAALDQARPHAIVDLSAAFDGDPALAGEAAKGRSQAAIRAMQIETELRTNPELRADRFVQAWHQLNVQRDRLSGWEHDDRRDQVEGRMKALAKSIDKDPALGAALSRRAGQLGIGRQQALQWNPGSRDGGIGREMAERMKTPSISHQLIQLLGRGRDRGMSL